MMGWIALIILIIPIFINFFGSKLQKGYNIEVIETGFSKNVYIYQLDKAPFTGESKRYERDGYSGGRQNFNTVEAAQEHIDKLLTPTKIEIIPYP
jgi:hypothetical protein